jgi:hypothetical protein
VPALHLRDDSTQQAVAEIVGQRGQRHLLRETDRAVARLRTMRFRNARKPSEGSAPQLSVEGRASPLD